MDVGGEKRTAFNKHAIMIIRHCIWASFLAIAAASAAFAFGGERVKKEDPKPVVTHTAIIKTTVGDIEIELYGVDAPKTVANFVGLAQKDFYNGILFHRVVPNFVIQAGDPKTKDSTLRSQWGRGGESIYGGDFADEVNPASPSRQQGYVAGALAMANRGPNTNTSQFFIVTNSAGGGGLAQYNTYTIFGMVTKGMDVVRKIEVTPANANQQPLTPIAIQSVTVTPVGGGNR